MNTSTFTSAIEKGKNIAAAAGVAGVLWSAYTVSGLPVPATLHQVDARLEKINDTVTSLKLDVLTSRRSTIGLSRNFLRNERAANIRTMENADAIAKVTFLRRIAEIDDSLKDLETDDNEIRAAINKLRP